MLYVTTREKNDAYTASKALKEDRGADGGLYLPMNLPKFDRAQLDAMVGVGFGECVAQVLNSFFSCRLTGWEVEQFAGRYPIRTLALNPKTIAAETFRNIGWDYRHLERSLCQLVCYRMEVENVSVSWFRMAARIAVLFAIYAEMREKGLIGAYDTFDISAPTGDFCAPMACWYAREMGLPITNIVCACNDNGAAWDLLNQGSMRTDAQTVKTVTPLEDFGVPAEIERLLHATLGVDGAMRFGFCVEQGSPFRLMPHEIEIVRKGLFAAVISSSRVTSLVPSAYSTCRYVMGPYSVLAYGALMDYRARTGERRPAVVLADRSPVCDGSFVAGALNISLGELKQRIEMS